MSKKKKKSAAAPKAPRKKGYLQVPCQEVVIGGKKVGNAEKLVASPGCTITRAPSAQLGIEKFNDAKDLKAKFNLDKPCTSKRKSCPVQLAFDDGQAFLRFCASTGKKRAGYRVNVESPAEAMTIAKKHCNAWAKEQKFDFPDNHPLGGKGK